MSDSDRVKWDARYAARGGGRGRAPEWLGDHDEAIPRAGRALDVAAGDGRLARWAAGRGLEVVAVDISSVGLARIAHPRVTTVVLDLGQEPSLPAGPFSLVTVFDYWQPSLFPQLRGALSQGGVLAMEVATVMNLARHAHPSRRWLAEVGRARDAIAGLEVIRCDEEWREDGRHTARVVGRRWDHGAD